MDIPYAIQQVLQQDLGVQGNVRTGVSWPAVGAGGVFLLELDESIDALMPIECVVVRGAGGPATYGSGTLPLNDQRVVTLSYGMTPHLAWNLDSAVYTALKGLIPSVWAQTYLHWVNPEIRATPLRDPDTQWPYVLSTWTALASDLTIAV